MFYVIKCFFFLKLTFDNVLADFFTDFADFFPMLDCKILDSIKNYVIAKSFVSCWKWSPILDHIDQLASINWDDPVIREMLVTNFSHLGILRFKDQWTKREKCKHDWCLTRESDAAMLWLIAVHSYHVVDIIIFHCVDQWFNKLLIQLKSTKVLLRILFWKNF